MSNTAFSGYSAGKAAKVGLISAASQIAGLLLYFFGIRIILSNFSKADNGDLVLVQTIGMFFSALVEGGLSGIAIREIAQYPQRASRLISTVLKLRLVLAGAAALLLLLCMYVLTSLETTVIMAIWCGYVFISAKGGVLRSIFEYRGRASGDVLILSIASFLDVALFAAILMLVPVELTVLNVAITYTIAAIPGFILLAAQFPEWKTWSIPFSKNVAIYLTKEYIPVMLPFLAMQVAARVHIGLLEIFQDREAVGVFGAALNVIAPLLTLTGAIITAIFPTISAGDKHDKERARTYIAAGAKIGLLLPVIMAAVATIGVDYVIWILTGGRYADDVTAFMLSFWYAPLEALFSYILFVNMAISRQRRNYITMGVYVLLSIILGVLFVPSGGEVAAIASRIAGLAAALLLSLYLLKDYLDAQRLRSVAIACVGSYLLFSLLSATLFFTIESIAIRMLSLAGSFAVVPLFLSKEEKSVVGVYWRKVRQKVPFFSR